MERLGVALAWGGIIGGIAFLVGFLGPLVCSPGSNQGPLLGIFITGPIGFAVGCLVGCFIPRRRG